MKKYLFLVVFSFALWACTSDSDVPVIEEEEPPALIPRQDIELSAVEQDLSEQTNAFAFNLLKTVYANETAHKNILLSPLSATLAFSMLNNGAAGTTQKEIQQTLGYGNVSPDAINKYLQKIINAMQELDSRGKFESANSIWIKQDYPVFNAFKQVNQQYYKAEIQNVDFSKPATVTAINNWVNEKTHGKITEILKEVEPFTRLILINALYFKGYWTDPFMKELTADAIFRTSTGSEQVVPMMRKTSGLAYSKLENCAAVELPFGNRAFSLVVVLPDEDTAITTVLEQMNGDWWKQLTDFDKFFYEGYLEGIHYQVKLEIPRFKLAYDRTLNDDLKALGMRIPFAMGAADFSLITQKEDLAISLVKQKTFAQMDEEGMEAAAVTLIGMVGSANIEFTMVDFKVNRPFLYFIKEKSSGLVFFAGIMNKII